MSAVLGAYFVAYPHARIVTLVPLCIIFYMLEIPAYIYLLFWFVVQQILPGVGSLGAMGSRGVAFWAHIGGFVGGAAFMYAAARWRAPPQTGGRLWARVG